MLAPMGIGGLYARRELLEELPPFLYGGDMIVDVILDRSTWNRLPWKFEAGTPDVGGVALGGAKDRASKRRLEGAVDYLSRIGMATVLNAAGIAVRAGGHCAYPLTRRLGVPGTVRVSVYLYNTLEEIDYFLQTLQATITHKLLLLG